LTHVAKGFSEGNETVSAGLIEKKVKGAVGARE
jgi:hypothetical protein